MELEKRTPTFEGDGELLDISRALAHGDKFREEPIAFTREAGISARTLAAALKELETAKLIVGTFRGRRKKYSTFALLQHLQPVYPLQGLQKSQPGNNVPIDSVHRKEPSNDLFSEKKFAIKTTLHLW